MKIGRRHAAIVGVLLALTAGAASGDDAAKGEGAGTLEEDAAFFEFLGSFVDEDGDWIDALALEPFVRQRPTGDLSRDAGGASSHDVNRRQDKPGEGFQTVEKDDDE